MIFVRNETIDFEGGRQVYCSPFEAFIKAASKVSWRCEFILPVTDRRAKFSDNEVENRVTKVGSARGFFNGILRAFEVILKVNSLRKTTGDSTLVVRIPEHTNIILLPLYDLFGFKIIIWLVHDRNKVTDSDLRARGGLRPKFAAVVSKLTGAIESYYLERCPVVANGGDLIQRYCGKNRNTVGVYSSLITNDDVDHMRSFARSVRYERSEIRLLYAGRVSVEKGIDKLLAFVSEVSSRAPSMGVSCSCTIIGKVDDTMSEYLSQRIESDASLPPIRLAGYMRRGDPLWCAFAQHDFLCLLSDAEGTPRVIPEAYACGLPVIVSQHANADKIVSEEELILNERDFGELADQVLKLHHDSVRYRQLSDSVQMRARSYTIEAVLAAFYRQEKLITSSSKMGEAC